MPNGHNMEHGNPVPLPMTSFHIYMWHYVFGDKVSNSKPGNGMFRSLFETAELQPQERPPHCSVWSYLLCAFAVDSTASAMYSM